MCRWQRQTSQWVGSGVSATVQRLGCQSLLLDVGEVKVVLQTKGLFFFPTEVSVFLAKVS